VKNSIRERLAVSVVKNGTRLGAIILHRLNIPGRAIFKHRAVMNGGYQKRPPIEQCTDDA